MGQLCLVGARLGPLLVQSPPALGYEAGTVARFVKILRSNFSGEIVFERRHRSWLNARALFESPRRDNGDR